VLALSDPGDEGVSRQALDLVEARCRAGLLAARYRVQRAQAGRGRPINDDRLDVEVALLRCELFGAVTLS
jgi:hypothetical protein